MLEPLWDIFNTHWADEPAEYNLEDDEPPGQAPLAIEDGSPESDGESSGVPTTQPEQTHEDFDPYADRVDPSLLIDDAADEEAPKTEESPKTEDVKHTADDQPAAASTEYYRGVPVMLLDSQPLSTPEKSQQSLTDSQVELLEGLNAMTLDSPAPSSLPLAPETPNASDSMPPPPPFTPAQRQKKLEALELRMTEIQYLAKFFFGFGEDDSYPAKLETWKNKNCFF